MYCKVICIGFVEEVSAIFQVRCLRHIGGAFEVVSISTITRDRGNLSNLSASSVIIKENKLVVHYLWDTNTFIRFYQVRINYQIRKLFSAFARN